MTTPTADAIALAVKLSGHTQCERALKHGAYRSEVATAMLQDEDYEALANEVSKPNRVCAGCLGDAATIDRELLLPQKHTALFAAQAVIDASLTLNGTRLIDVFEAIRELSQSLKAIKTTCPL